MNKTKIATIKSHNPYFNRWFSAIVVLLSFRQSIDGHNPYFNRWFSAIEQYLLSQDAQRASQSLF